MSVSNKLALLVVIALVVVVVGLALTLGNDNDRRSAESEPPAPAADIAPAPAEAKARKTFVLVDAYADWCGWCKKLDAETLSDPGVQARLREFTLLKLDTDRHPDVAGKYGISGLPTTLVLDAGGKVVLSQAGFMMPKEYLQLLDQAAGRR